MSPFQIITVTGLAGLLVWEIVSLVRGGSSSTMQWLRMLVWTAAIVLILNPVWMITVANALGIGRAPDLLVYVFVLAFLATSFYLYAQNVKLRRELTELVRRLAIRDVRPPQRSE